MLALLFAAQVLASQATPVQTVDLRGDRARQTYQSLYARGNRTNLPAFPAPIPRTVISLPSRQDRATSYAYVFPNRGARAAPAPTVTVPIQTFPLLLNPSIIIAARPAIAWSMPTATGAGTIAPQFAACTGYANVNAFGSPTLGERDYLNPSGYANINAFGAAAKISYTVYATGYANVQAFGVPNVQRGLHATGYANSQAFGSPTVTQGTRLNATGYAEVNGFGAPAVTYHNHLTATGYADADGFGSPVVTYNPRLHPAGYAEQNAFGAAVVTGRNRVTATGIAATDRFGFPSTTAVYLLNAIGVPATDEFGGTGSLWLQPVSPAEITMSDAQECAVELTEGFFALSVVISDSIAIVVAVSDLRGCSVGVSDA